MPDLAPGATAVAYGNWEKTYTIVWRKAVTLQVDPYSVGFCTLFKADARVDCGEQRCPMCRESCARILLMGEECRSDWRRAKGVRRSFRRELDRDHRLGVRLLRYRRVKIIHVV